MTPTILITRPDPAGAEFSDRIRDRLGPGVTIVLAPVMQIEFHDTPPDLGGVRTLIFTSANGVLAYVRSTDRRDIGCYCVGDATAALAQEHGMAAISCSGTADDLVARIVADGVQGPCLHIRGEHGAGNVAARLSAAGIPTQEVVLYRQAALPISNSTKHLLCGECHVILPLFSPRTAALLFAGDMTTANLTVAALSANVAAALPEAFAGELVVAKRPDAEAMLDTIQGIVDHGKALEA
ncbi:uroporphyrinogen-III synthase [Roseovarius sp. CAU 1744]|uniref:uroporphyrinogen-III synthase n=1 Tax=Roseovarius sp. CAU 1744 TaxID=3140368 RepID=UPI00325B4A02